jgi:hypothetical protein
MIKTQIVKENNKPVAVIMDYREYLRLQELVQDKSDYYAAVRTKKQTKKWFSHSEVKKELGL